MTCCCRPKFLLAFFINIFIRQLNRYKIVINCRPYTKFRLLSDDMMTGFVQAAIVGTQSGGGAAPRCRVMPISVVSVEVRTRVQNF